MSSDSETRTREDLCGIDSYPVSVSSEHVERKERGDPLFAANLGSAAKTMESSCVLGSHQPFQFYRLF